MDNANVTPVSCSSVSQSQLLHRMDAEYWHPRYAVLDELFARVKYTTIGALDPFMTYGAITPGERPPPADAGVVRIDPAAFRPTGLDLSECVRVPEGSKWDAPKTRVQRGDLLVVRSGVASIGRCAVFDRLARAVVGCFVDIVRQSKLCPYYLCAFLHSRPGRLQIERLMNGVGTVNISFGEIRSVGVVLMDDTARLRVSDAWSAAAKAHAAGATRKAARLQREAIGPFDALI